MLFSVFRVEEPDVESSTEGVLLCSEAGAAGQQSGPSQPHSVPARPAGGGPGRGRQEEGTEYQVPFSSITSLMILTSF